MEAQRGLGTWPRLHSAWHSWDSDQGSWVLESVLLASGWEGEGWTWRGGPASFETSGSLK